MRRFVGRLRLSVGRRLVTQDLARANAADASATLRERRRDREDVDAYLKASRPTNAADRS